MMFAMLLLQAAPLPAADCGALSTSQEADKCYVDRMAVAMARVEKSYRRNLDEASAVDRDRSGTDAPTARAQLEASQRAWLAYARAQCDLESWRAKGGSAEQIYNITCIERLALKRLDDLRSPMILESQRLNPVPEE